MSDFTSGADFKAHIALCPSCREPFQKNQVWQKLCLTCYLDKKGKRRAVPSVRTATVVEPIEATMLKRLIQLCHPDRHGNSEASNTATQWLLQQRGAAHG